MIHTRDHLAEQYTAALEEYLADGSEAALHAAYEIGRRAIAEGVGVLEMLAVHNRSLNNFLAETLATDRLAAGIQRASAFLAESLSPFEMVLRGFRETNTSLRNSLEQIRIVERELQRQNQQLVEAHETLLAERQRYQDLFDFAPDSYLVTDMEGTIQEANSPAAALLQTSHEVLVGRSLSSFVVPGDLLFFENNLARLQASELEKLEFWRISVLKADGKTIPVSMTLGTVRDAQGRPAGLRCMLRDVTERQQLEEDRAQLRIREHLIQAKTEAAQRFKFLAEISTALVSSLDYASIPNIIALLSAPQFGEECFVYLTDEAMNVRYFAASKADPEKPSLVRSVPVQSLPAELPAPVARVLREGKAAVFSRVSASWVSSFYQDAGEEPAEQPSERSALLVPLIAHGSLLGAMAFVSSRRQHTLDDLALAEELARRCALVIENAKLYQQVVTARDKAEKASHAKEEFVAVLSHELRTPLMVILGWSRVLSRQPELAHGTVFSEGVQSLDHNAQILRRLVEDCLDIARISEGKIRLQTRIVSLNRIAHSAFAATRELASEKDIHFTAELSDPELPELPQLYVSGDPTRLEQVLLNILTNAIRYTPSGGQVTLRLGVVGEEACITAQDSGMGIDAESLDKIFKPFHQGAMSWDASGAGLGLGLAIAHEIVELHGGRIWAESPGPGAGSTFHLRLPLAAPLPEAAATLPAMSSATSSTTLGQAADRQPETVLPISPPLRILFVEDSTHVLSLFRLEFETLGCTVFTATDGDKGFEIAQREILDVIVSDVRMPNCDGYELMRRVRRVPKLAGVPAIAMTGFGVKKDVEEALDAGYNAHLCKPVELPDLVAAMRKLIDERDLRAGLDQRRMSDSPR